AGVCVPDPAYGGCQPPFHNNNDSNFGGPHSSNNAVADINKGKMDGFVKQSEGGARCSTSTTPTCAPCTETATPRACDDVMGYHDAREIPNYWEYARNFVLQDQMYPPIGSWSLPNHLAMVSGWSALCPAGTTDPLRCVSTTMPNGGPYAWTDITWLLNKSRVSWGYYVFEGTEPDCEIDEADVCKLAVQKARTPSIWNPLPQFTDVTKDGQLGNIQTLTNFYTAAHDS